MSPSREWVIVLVLSMLGCSALALAGGRQRNADLLEHLKIVLAVLDEEPRLVAQAEILAHDVHAGDKRFVEQLLELGRGAAEPLPVQAKCGGRPELSDLPGQLAALNPKLLLEAVPENLETLGRIADYVARKHDQAA